ncbi:hypothetical protein [Pedobacter frigiditerrae]|uniref:hypothetical protein n=1 Tax=Pedobacter frigiditerrae TaxID=2530452 RepID=UPI00292D48D6|nr:hypothetical protein [Pedobacter frigiditerrae]
MNKTEFKIRIVTCLVSAILCVMTAYNYKDQCRDVSVIKKDNVSLVVKKGLKKKA